MGRKKTIKRIKARFNRIRQVLNRLTVHLFLYSKGKKPIAIVMVDGGFCSVLTKYVLGKCIETQLGMEVKYDLSWFDTNGLDCDGQFNRTFQFTQVYPHLDFPVADRGEIETYKKYFHFDNPSPYIFNRGLFKKRRPLYIDGYYEHWKYFQWVEDIVQQDFSFEKIKLNSENEHMLEQISSSSESVAIHVRRGDFVNIGLCILTPEYYLEAIKYISTRLQPVPPDLYFFSNDIDWVNEHIVNQLPESIQSTCVNINDNDTGYLDLMLISKCNHQITSNSSFGYWGGLLNSADKKMVIVPDRWAPATSGKPDKKLAGSEIAHNLPGWTVFSCNTHQPV
jgi:hypothetical protein